MEFSPVVSCSGALCRWSPNGTMLAHAAGSRIIVRDAASLKIMSSHTCLDRPDTIFWSPTSELVAASISSLAVTHVFCPSDESWFAKISEGPVGLATAKFSPDGRHVLALSDFSVKLTIWSLSSKQVRYIKLATCYDFSPDGDRLAVAERATSATQEAGPSSAFNVAIYDCSDWEELSRFSTECPDVAGLSWEPKRGDKLAVWNGPLQYTFQIFSASGRGLLTYSSEAQELGVKALSWSPCGQLLVTGGHGSDIRIFNAVNCTYFASFEHVEEVSGKDYLTQDCSIFEEKEVPPEDIDGKIIQVTRHL